MIRVKAYVVLSLSTLLWFHESRLSIGKRILMSMGWKPGEGVGAKMSRKHRKKLKWSLTQQTPKDLPPSSPPPPSEEPASGVKVYGVALPPPSFQQVATKASRLDDDDEYFDDQIVNTTLLCFLLKSIWFFSTRMLVCLHWIMKYIFNYKNTNVMVLATRDWNRWIYLDMIIYLSNRQSQNRLPMWKFVVR